MVLTKTNKNKTHFSAPLHAFRGFSILFIVAVHSWAVPIFINSNSKTDAGIKWANTLNEVLFHDSILFERSISAVPRWLNVLADYAFPIYFVHGVFLYLSIILLRSIGGTGFNAMQIMLAGLVNLVLILIFSTLIIAGFKRLLGKKSRVLIGA